MIEIKLTIPGCPIVKKNSSTTSYRVKNKNGGYNYLDRPIHYYTDAYKDWVRGAVQVLAVYKTHHPEIKFPIQDKMNLKCLFFMKDNRVVDLSALYEGIQDCLAGNEKWLNVHPQLYKIIEDDSCRYIGSHDGSRVLYNPVDPHLEFTLSPYIL